MLNFFSKLNRIEIKGIFYGTIDAVELRQLNFGDYEELKKSMIEAYANWPGAYWQEAHFQKLLKIFPEG